MTTLLQGFFAHQVFTLIGAHLEVIPAVLKPGEVYTLSLSEHGVPSNATILEVRSDIFPEQVLNSVSPVEMPWKTVPKHRQPHVRLFAPWSYVPWDQALPTQAQFCVVWVPASEDTDWDLLVDAFRFFDLGRYDLALLPAHVAFEAKLSRLITDHMARQGISPRALKEHRRSSSNAQDLNLLLPAFLNRLPGALLLPDDLRANLNKLRKRRNDFAHEGRTDPPLEKLEIATLLCSAVFGALFLDVARASLIPAQQTT